MTRILILYLLASSFAYSSTSSLECRAALLIASTTPATFSSNRSMISFQEIPVTAASLLAAHKTGYLPERGDTWERPQTRGVVLLNEKEISHSSRKNINRLMAAQVKITWNSDTESIIDNCAQMTRKEGNSNWMTPEVIAGYKELYKAGYIFSVEIRDPHTSEILAGEFGIYSNGHVQGISKFRNIGNALSDGTGHLLDAVLHEHFASKGISVFDVEVATINKIPKPGVTAQSGEDFSQTLLSLNQQSLVLFDQAQLQNPSPPFESQFFSRYRQMQTAKNYKLKR